MDQNQTEDQPTNGKKEPSYKVVTSERKQLAIRLCSLLATRRCNEENFKLQKKKHVDIANGAKNIARHAIRGEKIPNDSLKYATIGSMEDLYGELQKSKNTRPLPSCIDQSCSYWHQDGSYISDAISPACADSDKAKFINKRQAMIDNYESEILQRLKGSSVTRFLDGPWKNLKVIVPTEENSTRIFEIKLAHTNCENPFVVAVKDRFKVTNSEQEKDTIRMELEIVYSEVFSRGLAAIHEGWLLLEAQTKPEEKTCTYQRMLIQSQFICYVAFNYCYPTDIEQNVNIRMIQTALGKYASSNVLKEEAVSGKAHISTLEMALNLFKTNIEIGIKSGDPDDVFFSDFDNAIDIIGELNNQCHPNIENIMDLLLSKNNPLTKRIGKKEYFLHLFEFEENKRCLYEEVKKRLSGIGSKVNFTY